MRVVFLFLVISLSIISCNNEEIEYRYVLENDTSQQVTFFAYDNSPKSSNDFVSDQVTLNPMSEELILEIGVDDREGRLESIREIFSISFDVTPDSLVIQFENGEYLSYTISDPSPISPLSPFNYNNDSSLWSLETIEGDFGEYRFIIGSAHEDAAQ